MGFIRAVGRFFLEWWRVGVSGTSRATLIVKIVVLAIALVLLLKADQEMRIVLPDDTEIPMRVGVFIAVSIFAGWAVLSCGIAWARRHGAILAISDLLVFENQFGFFRLKITNIGCVNAIEVCVEVERAVDSDAHAVLDTAHGAIEVRWTGVDGKKRVNLNKDGHSRTATPLQIHEWQKPGAHLHIATISERAQSLDGTRRFGKMWVLISARADNALAVQKWFAVERDPKMESGYRTQREDPPDDVLKAAPSP